MKSDGLDLLKPFLPGLEAALDDPDVSEIMINGPGNVWLEEHGRLRPIDAPRLNAAALERAAIHIARPLGLDPATTPILDARLDDGSRVAICVPAGQPVRRDSPCGDLGNDRFRPRSSSNKGALPAHIRHEAERVLRTRRNILVSGGTGSGKTTLLNALIELLPDDERIVAIEDTLELRIDAPELRPVRGAWVAARERLRSATSCATPCGIGPITSSSGKCAAARPLTCCKPSTPDTAARSPPSTPTTQSRRSHGSPVAPCKAAATSRGM